MRATCPTSFILLDFTNTVISSRNGKFEVEFSPPSLSSCLLDSNIFLTSFFSVHPSIHLWRYSPFRALASFIRRLHSSLIAPLLLRPLIPSSCRASLFLLVILSNCYFGVNVIQSHTYSRYIVCLVFKILKKGSGK